MTAAAESQEAAWETKMERLRHRSLPERVLRICDDTALRQEHDAAGRAVSRARLLADSDPDNATLARRATAATRRYEAAAEALHKASVCLTFRALPRPALEELIHTHPPTDQQAADGAAFNPDTFPAALIAVSCTDGMSEAEARELLDSWSAPDANALWESAWEVQQEARTGPADLGKD
ncbi:hypothetical protein [Streptomyces sp. NBC_00658]|uniref:hypothetical protein n=1 Tax=Streptomyces sp. NBC_00658 TaxID=2975800 RepID=UPI003251DE00